MNIIEVINASGTVVAILTSAAASFAAWRAGRQKELSDLKDAINKDLDALRQLLNALRLDVDELERDQHASRERAAAEGSSLAEAKAALNRIEGRLYAALGGRDGHS